MAGKRANENNILINNSADLLTSEESYQTVKVDDNSPNRGYYLARRQLGQIISRNTGYVLEEKYFACLIGKIIDGKVIPLNLGDPIKKSYMIDTSIFSGFVVNNDILEELKEKGYDVSLITEISN